MKGMDSPKIRLSNICKELRMELNLVITDIWFMEKLLFMSLSCYLDNFQGAPVVKERIGPYVCVGSITMPLSNMCWVN